LASALFHFREHLDPIASISRSQAASHCPDYDLIADIANASKHAHLTRGTPQIGAASSLKERIVIVEYEDDGGSYRHAQKQVYAKLSDGTERDLFEIATSVINYWGNELVRLGIIKAFKQFPAPIAAGSCFVPRAEARGIDFEIVRGVRFKQEFQMLRFDSIKGQSVPVDLTGHKLQFRIYKPAMCIALTFKNDVSGEEREFEIALTESQSTALNSLQTGEDQNAYIQEIIDADDTVRPQILEFLLSVGAIQKIAEQDETQQPPLAALSSTSPAIGTPTPVSTRAPASGGACS
jgi:hypothetical protein